MDDDGTEPNHPPCEANNNKHHKCLTGKKMLQYILQLDLAFNNVKPKDWYFVLD